MMCRYGGSNFSTGGTDEVLAGGAFGSPDRYSTYNLESSGNWERTIALYRFALILKHI